MIQSPQARPSQTAVPRSTEGREPDSAAKQHKASETKSERKRGRPKGSRNKPKALIPAETAQAMLGLMRDTLPPEIFADLRDAVKSGKNISSLSEAKILLKLMGPPVWIRLAEEASKLRGQQGSPDIDPDLVDEIGGIDDGSSDSQFARDTNERLKIMIALIKLVDEMERNDESKSDSEKPVLEIIARRGIDAARIDFITGTEPRIVGGNVDGAGRSTIEVRAIPSSVSERPFDVSDSEQESPVGVLNDNSIGDDPRGDGQE